MCIPILDFVATVDKKWQASKFVVFFSKQHEIRTEKNIFWEKSRELKEKPYKTFLKTHLSWRIDFLGPENIRIDTLIINIA